MAVIGTWFLHQVVAFSHFYSSNMFFHSVISALTLFCSLIKSKTLLNLALISMLNFNKKYRTFETIDDTLDKLF